MAYLCELLLLSILISRDIRRCADPETAQQKEAFNMMQIGFIRNTRIVIIAGIFWYILHDKNRRKKTAPAPQPALIRLSLLRQAPMNIYTPFTVKQGQSVSVHDGADGLLAVNI
ncbi:uncharacterized protein FOMMEDRAFT_158783 [Fomitiporia mediterranea MF3/22]|uniref:uncharacterized protein n=1 Tax=Fomitiporia mediterranea (strain MF3/22) TaxID=694068 RepID=UPI0004409AA1|nr:uncharacterized protein FOMMEDRAFT_158783 [Fomitiporia mediterranea MF3/22]EJD01629.1 hypothetical protein FOMMEDRAFT_158783 [Fomitiporia mediterranea MF3/22]